ncbi:glycosyltransferase family 2 protein [bacterium]|nr:glycosyltransferase family 2 protein [candidate division CSSED10-310 bacterium]
MSRYSLSVFFPAHNEIESLPGIVKAAGDICRELVGDFEIIIVDDGSTDGTSELADRLESSEPGVRVVHHGMNRGYGGALRSGFLSAKKDLIFYTDADAQFDMAELRDVLPMIETADVVTCYRTGRCDPWHRSLNTWLFEKTVSLVFGLKIRDPDCAYKIYRREVIEQMELTSDGAMIDVEMLLQAQRAGYRIVQRGVRHYPRKSGMPSGANIRVILKAFREMIRLWRRLGSRLTHRPRPAAPHNTHPGASE